MRQKNETETSFNQLKEITQIMQAQKTPMPKSENASASEPTQKSTPKPKGEAHAKKGVLNPTKKAFSERQRTELTHNQALIKAKRPNKIKSNAITQTLLKAMKPKKGGKNDEA
ncbi:hypothetical protein HpHA295_11840 [Helicobacter pylori]